MKRPNITPAEAQEYLKNAADNIRAAIMRYVRLGRITEAEAQEYLKKATEPHRLPVMVIAIRGYYLNSMGKANENDRGIFDDAMAVIGPNYFKTFNANTDPSRYEKGIGMILPGWHLYKIGKHGISGPRPYDAFRPATPDESIPGLRDGQNGIKKIITPNIHSGGDVSVNSKACQTILKSQWPEFQKDIYAMMRTEAQRVLPYLLLENM
jgi:lysozyme